MKLQTFDLRYSVVKRHFKDDGTQNCFVHQPIYRCSKKIGNNKQILAWKPKGLSDESIKPHATSNNSYSPTLHYLNTKIRVKFDGSCIKQDKLAFHYKTVVNIYIVYKINNLWPFKQMLILGSLGAFELKKNGHFDKYQYSRYGVGFGARKNFSLCDGSEFGKKK